MWLCPSDAVAVTMYVSAPETGAQDTVLPPHDVETETLLGEHGPGEKEGRNCEKERLLSVMSFIQILISPIKEFC